MHGGNIPGSTPFPLDEPVCTILHCIVQVYVRVCLCEIKKQEKTNNKKQNKIQNEEKSKNKKKLKNKKKINNNELKKTSTNVFVEEVVYKSGELTAVATVK